MSVPYSHDIPPLIEVSELPADPAVLLQDRGYAFWNSEPTGVWAPKATETLNAIQQGADIVTLSGRNGVGKTMQFLRLLEWTLDDRIIMHQAQEAAHYNYVSDTEFVVLDEFTKPAAENRTELVNYMATQLLETPTVVIAPAVTRRLRRDNLDATIDALALRRPNLAVHDLGDVNIAPVSIEAATVALKAVEVDEEAIAFFATQSALRNARLFERLVFSPSTLQDNEQLRTADGMVELLTALTRRGRMRGDHYRNAIASSVMPIGSEDEDHVLFRANEFTTDQAIEMYNFLGVPLPSRYAFDVDELGFDPYDKN
ncbi:MAG: hypothetical protein WBP22_02615 [Candidatus Saccharimonas sp.]